MTQNYTSEFKEMIVSLYNKGESVESLASEYGVGKSTVYKWIDIYAVNKETGLSKKEIEEMNREIRRLKEENTILKKAMTIFAKK